MIVARRIPAQPCGDRECFCSFIVICLGGCDYIFARTALLFSHHRRRNGLGLHLITQGGNQGLDFVFRHSIIVY